MCIDTLPVYAALCSHFIVVAPYAVHVDTDMHANSDTYCSRGWCVPPAKEIALMMFESDGVNQQVPTRDVCSQMQDLGA